MVDVDIVTLSTHNLNEPIGAFAERSKAMTCKVNKAKTTLHPTSNSKRHSVSVYPYSSVELTCSSLFYCWYGTTKHLPSSRKFSNVNSCFKGGLHVVHDLQLLKHQRKLNLHARNVFLASNSAAVIAIHPTSCAARRRLRRSCACPPLSRSLGVGSLAARNGAREFGL